MSRNFHEDFSSSVAKLPSERSTGIVFAAVAAAIAWGWHDHPAVLWAASAIAFICLSLSLLAPTTLAPLNRGWFRFSLLLNRMVSPLVMFAIFAAVFVPGGFLMRLRRDPLRTKRLPETVSYWIDRPEVSADTNSMNHQF